MHKVTWKITEHLLLKGKKWDSIQQFKLKEGITDKLTQERKTKGYVNKFLIDCKSWSGPCTLAEEIFKILLSKPY